MRHASKMTLALALLLLTTKLAAADIAANAIRDVMRLVGCMKALDAICANSLTYTKVLEEHGIARDQLDQSVTDLYQKLKSIHGSYSRFDVSAPWPPFASHGRKYIFIPYSALLKSPARNVSTTSFFVGVSEDDGISWKFVDGLKVTSENIGMIIPGYSGGRLPPQVLTQSPSQ
jgi:hypothetical protein